MIFLHSKGQHRIVIVFLNRYYLFVYMSIDTEPRQTGVTKRMLGENVSDQKILHW